MGRIDRLPGPVKQRLHELLQAGVPQSDILRQLEPLLDEHGEAPLSRSGLNRYASRMEAIGRRIRETRAAAEAWSRQLGDAGGDVSGHAIDLLRTFVVEASLRSAEDPELPVETIGELALAVQRLERAASSHAARERALRRELAELAAAEAGKAAGAAAAEAGYDLPPEALQAIREQVYGIVDA